MPVMKEKFEVKTSCSKRLAEEKKITDPFLLAIDVQLAAARGRLKLSFSHRVTLATEWA